MMCLVTRKYITEIQNTDSSYALLIIILACLALSLHHKWLEIFLWTSSGFFLIFYSIFLINNWNECWSRRSILPRLIINLSDRNLVLKVSLELFRLNTSNLENIANNLYLFVSWIIIFVWQGSLATLFTYISHPFYKL